MHRPGLLSLSSDVRIYSRGLINLLAHVTVILTALRGACVCETAIASGNLRDV